MAFSRFLSPAWFAVTDALPTGAIIVEPRPSTMRFDDDRGTAYCEGRWQLRTVAGERIMTGARVLFDEDGIVWLAEGGVYGGIAAT